MQVYGVLQDNAWAIQLARVSGAITALSGMLDSRERACRAVAAVSLRALCLNSSEACKVSKQPTQCLLWLHLWLRCSLDGWEQVSRAVAAVPLRSVPE